MKRTGKCLCGAVSYSAEVNVDASVCHCGMCRRWAGGPLFVVSATEVVWNGDDGLRVFSSSAWAERGFCSACGTGLFYRLTAPGPHQGALSLCLGTLDDQSGLELAREWFIDKKPEVYTLAGERKTFTEAEVFAMFGGSD